MSFTIPHIRGKPNSHHDDCYFSIVNISQYKKGKDKRTAVVHLNIHGVSFKLSFLKWQKLILKD